MASPALWSSRTRRPGSDGRSPTTSRPRTLSGWLQATAPTSSCRPRFDGVVPAGARADWWTLGSDPGRRSSTLAHMGDESLADRYQRLLVDVGAGAQDFGNRPIASHWPFVG